MRTFSHTRKVRSGDWKLSPVRAVTDGTLDGSFGPDRERRLIVSLEKGDIISIRPQGTRRPEIGSAFDIYRFLIRARANRLALEKARLKKEAKQRARESAAIRRADAKLVREARKENNQAA